MQHLSEQEIVRRDNLNKLTEAGINAFPSTTFEVTATTKEIKDNFKEGDTTYQEVTLAGRLMSRRIMGKASFAELQDSEGRIQIYISRDDICPGDDKVLYNDAFKKWFDLGDFIGIKGYAFYTQVGECSVHVTELKLLSKSLKP
ncbi:MAG TPA: OB-fold nucleic acid binding domain-containing protein, partial [Saprospiraceae bacterium]|nr:OB-fold nucleic acid binding domain-containing protein [Saprospiraceae bacterium]